MDNNNDQLFLLGYARHDVPVCEAMSKTGPFRLGDLIKVAMRDIKVDDRIDAI